MSEWVGGWYEVGGSLRLVGMRGRKRQKSVVADGVICP